MSNSRLILRLLLVLAVIAVSLIAWRFQQRKAGSYYYDQAMNQLKFGDRKAARFLLQRQIEVNRDHSDAHLKLSEIYLAEAKEEGHTATYESNPFALHELEEAARSNPGDDKLQKQYLKVCLAAPYIESAVRPAALIYANDKNDADAVFALAWDALDRNNNQDADKYIKQLEEKTDNPRPFQTARLRYGYFSRTAPQSPDIQKLLDDTVAQVVKKGEANKDVILDQDPLEREAMVDLLVVSVQQAVDEDSATARATRVIEICEKLALHDRQRVEEAGAKASDEEESANRKKRAQLVADQAIGYYANLVSRAVALLNEKYFIDPNKATIRARREALSDRANKLRMEAIRAKVASPLVYHQAALVAFSNGKPEESLGILDQGIAEAKKLPEDRRKQLLELHLLAARQCIMARLYERAEKQIQPLLDSDDQHYVGWGHLYRGAVHTFRGAHERAKEDYERAKQELGTTPMVRMALANSCLALKEWKQALEHLSALRGEIGSNNDPETSVWKKLQQASSDQLRWGEFQAQMELGNWKEASGHLEGLSQSPELGPRAFVMAAQYFQNKGDPQRALQLLSDGRKKFEKNILITQSFALLLHQSGHTAEATNEIQRLAVANKDNVTAQALLVRWLLMIGKNQEALAVCDALQPRFPKNPVLLVMLAQCYLNADRPEDAKSVAETLKTVPGGERYAELINLAIGLKIKDFVRIDESLGKLQEEVDGNIALMLVQARAALEQRDYDRAIDSLSALVDRTAIRDVVGKELFAAVMRFAETKGPEAAQAKIEPLLIKYPDQHYLLIARAELCFRQGKFDQGFASLDELERAEPKQPAAFYLRATAWLKRGRTDMAMEQVRKALELDPKHVDSIGLKAQLLLDKKDYKSAFTEAETGLRMLEEDQKPNAPKPDGSKLVLVQVDALIAAQKYAPAVQLAGELVSKNPKLREARLRLSKAYEEAGQLKEAVLTFRQGHEQASVGKSDFQVADADTFWLLAEEVRLLVRHRQLDEAKRRIAEVLGSSPAADQCLGLADAFLSAKQYDAALQWGEAGLSKLPDNQKWAAHLIIGKTQALWLKADPSKSELQAEARRHLEEVVQVYPRIYDASMNLAYLLSQSPDTASRGLQVALELRHEALVSDLPLEFIDTLAICYAAAKQPADAEKLLTDAIKLHPENVMLSLRLAKVWIGMGKTLSARQQLDRITQMNGITADQLEDAKRQIARLDGTESAKP